MLHNGDAIQSFVLENIDPLSHSCDMELVNSETGVDGYKDMAAGSLLGSENTVKTPVTC